MRFVASKVLGVAAGIALLSFSSVAYAQTTTLGDGTGPHAVPTTATFPPVGDSLIAEVSTNYDSGLVGNQRVAGTLYSAVFATSNAQRDFYFQFTVTAGTAPVTSLDLSGFSGYTVSVGQNNTVDIDGTGNAYGSPFTTGGIAANFAQLNSGTVSFTFSSAGSGAGTVPLGGKSVTLLVRTNATTYSVNNGIVKGGTSANALIYAPNQIGTDTGTGTASAPEPSDLALVIPGTLGIVGVIARRRISPHKSA